MAMPAIPECDDPTRRSEGMAGPAARQREMTLPKPYYEHAGITIYGGDVREVLPTLEGSSVHCCVTSPPYWDLRDYGVEGQLGLERTPEEYIAAMVGVLQEVKRVLRDDGTLWLNMGDSYSSFKDSKAVPDSLRNGDPGTAVAVAN